MNIKLISILAFSLLFTGLFCNAQQQSFANLHPDSVMHQNPRMAQMMFEPGEVLVRFADEVQININKANGFVKTSVASIDALFETYQVSEAEQLFPGAVQKSEKKFITTFSGEVIEVPNLHNIYKLKFDSEQQNVDEIISELSTNKEIIYAEPNSHYMAIGNDVQDAADQIPALNQEDALNAGNKNYNKSAISVNDPFYNQQGYISAIKADSAWSVTTGDSTEIIAILDTGIDWLHPDLMNKIWVNENEQENYQDSDGNGFADDIRGWDFINNRNNPMDDNGHGTHVAGIAGAETNNGIGIAGISWKARLMPVKVFSSNGYGDAGTISQGIIYAAANGATIINMSFGGYHRSFTMENALLNAYLTADLVAGSGNDGLSIYDRKDDTPAVFYPAALPIVLGVQANASFSNFDPDGPIFSTTLDGLNYELIAPGSAISTYLNGSYRNLSGTSMATPIVAGAIALYKAAHPEKNKEELWGDLIHFSHDIIDIYESITNESKFPVLDIKAVQISDTLAGNNGDGFYNAGETILINAMIRNTFGYADSVYIKLQYNEYENPDDVTFISDSAYLGSISTYASKSNYSNPFQVLINPLISNDKLVTLDLLMKNKGDTIEYIQQIQFRVYNGTYISGFITEDITLTPDKLWIFNRSTRIENGVTMTVRPGTHVEINAGVDSRGMIICEGTQDSLIYLKGGFGGNASYKFCDMNLKGGSVVGTNIDNCTIYNLSEINCDTVNMSNISDGESVKIYNIHRLSKSRFSNIRFYGSAFYGDIIQCTFENIVEFFPSGSMINSVFDNLINGYVYVYPTRPDLWSNYFMKRIEYQDNPMITGNSLLSLGHMMYFFQSYGGLSSVNLPDNYWGTENTEKIEEKFYDFWEDAGSPFLIYEPRLVTPSPEAPSHVWKILVDGIDAQDGVIEPLGVGTHKFEVYFNRPMDISYDALVTFGVRFPFTQHTVNDSVSWSADSTIFTTYKTFEIYTGDGINRIRVADARDTDGWDIPVEDNRFEILVDAAGSASIDFTATPGIGKVALEWHEPDDLPTLLGYNMYRFHHITDTTFSDTTLVNTNLVNDTLFTDFSVNPLQKYYYMYKIVRTDFTESDFSKVVNATVLTASPGDANGDQSVNVLDITSIVGYILNQNPQPFLSEAADVNGDGFINLLDIIGVVNIIMGDSKQPLFSEPAYAYLEPETIRFKSDGTLSGFQFQLIGPQIDQLELRSLLPGFEYIKYLHGDTLTGVIFSLDNKLIPEGEVNLFDIKHHPGTLAWGQLFAGNSKGDYVPVYKDATSLPEDYRYSFVLYPNPSEGIVNLKMNLPERANIQINIFNILGQIVYNDNIKDVVQGQSIQSIYLNKRGIFKGIHFISISYGAKDKQTPTYRKVEKLIIK